MKKYALIPVLAFLTIAANLDAQSVYNYPKTKKVDTVDTYFGVKVPDPYRWLEDDRSEETAQWVKAENEVTFAYLDKIPQRDRIKEYLTEIWNYPKYSIPFKEKGYYFFYKNDGIQNQSVLYIQDGLEGEPRVFIDPNKFSEKGTTAMSGFNVSKDAKYAAYATSDAGSDWKTIHVKVIETGELLSDRVDWVKFSGISWKGEGFYYSSYDAPKKGEEFSQKNEYHKVYYHKLGDTQDKDQLIFEDKKHPLRNFYVSTTDDERYLMMYCAESTSGNAVYFKDLEKSDAGFIAIDTTFDHEYSVIDNIDDKLLVSTNHSAPMNRIVLIDTKNPGVEHWETIIPEKEYLLRSSSICNRKLVTSYLKDVSTRLYIHDLNGKLETEIKLPGLGVADFSGDKEDHVAFYSFVNYTNPNTTYKFDMNTYTSELYRKSEIKFNSDEYETTQVFYPSKDGTEIPMFITHKKGVQLNGNNPTFLYGYGGFNISITPRFSLSSTVFLENGGVYAVANLRGGGEYGEEWHKAGTLLNKQNVFDDFIAAAEYLIAKGYTNPEKLAVHGRSNGGLLIGAVMTQRPDLFKVALPGVGVLDMLRYHQFTIGWAWATDYGTSADKENFDNLMTYSPLHNVREVEYPATLVTTADHDDRVVPAHSFKFAATLQEKHQGDNPVMIRIDVDAGHGAGKPTAKQIEEATDTWSFVFYNLGMDVK